MNFKSRTIFCVLVAIFLFSGFGNAKYKVYMNQWQTAPISIKGALSEWQGAAVDQMKKWEIDYRFANNSQYLYGLLILKNWKFTSSMRQTGLTVWINLGKKKKKSFGINFLKGQVDAVTFIKLMEKTRGPLPEEQKVKIRGKRAYSINQYKIINKKGRQILNINPDTSISPLFQMQWKKNKTIIEFRIPLQRSDIIPAGIGAATSDQIILGFAWGGMTDAMRKEMMNRRAAMASRTDAGRPIDINQERPKNIPRGDMPLRRPKKYIFWVPIKLASQ